MLRWLERRRYRREAATLAMLLCPGTIAASGGYHIKALARSTLISLYGPAIDKKFAAGSTPEQGALAVLASLVDSRVRDLSEKDRALIGVELRNQSQELTQPISKWIDYAVAKALEWERIAKVHRPDIDLFMKEALSSVS